MVLPLGAAVALALVASSSHRAAAVPGGEEISGAGQARLPDLVHSPPDHPALRERFEFGPVLRIEHRRRDRRQFERRLAEGLSRHALPKDLFGVFEPLARRLGIYNASKGTQMLMPTLAVEDYFPNSLRNQYEVEEQLGEGSFGVTFLATDKVTHKQVAVKVFKYGTSWLTPKRVAEDDYAKELVEESREECIKVKKIHENDDIYPDGAVHVVNCLEDGISEAMADPAKEDSALYVVMNNAGENTNKWWYEKALLKEGQQKEGSALLRKVTRDMMKGLRLLTDKDAKTKWVHHDLKPDNMAVLTTPSSGGVETKLSLIDLGTAFPDTTPTTEKHVCTPIFQPPEFSGLSNPIGYSLPIHSFDAGSAALSILSMAGGADYGQEMSLPIFYLVARQVGMSKVLRMHTLSSIATCISERNGANRDDLDKWIPIYQACLKDEGLGAAAKAAADQMFDRVKQAPNEASRIFELTSLISCNAMVNNKPVNLALTSNIVSEWVKSGFDEVLMDMMSHDPTQRPTPEEVLQAKWLDEGFATEDVATPPNEIRCVDMATLATTAMFWSIGVPALVIIWSGVVAFGCCCLGCCCHVVGKIPSPAFTAMVASTFVLSSAAISSVWLSQTLCFLLVCLSLVLGPVLCVSGCSVARSTGDSTMKMAWSNSLSAAALFNLLVFCAIRWNAGPTLDFLAFLLSHHQEVDDRMQNMEAASKLMPDYWERALLFCIWLTFIPPWGGIVSALFGLWRENVHGRLSRPVPVQRQIVGTELQKRPSESNEVTASATGDAAAV